LDKLSFNIILIMEDNIILNLTLKFKLAYQYRNVVSFHINDFFFYIFHFILSNEVKYLLLMMKPVPIIFNLFLFINFS